ncbi:iron complex transport system substrate-binding protein [Bacillus altitudinis]|nr:iron complex transport system substrate-binding protein [Bacillus altitudinis]SNS44856.1 iron complex transport system substrate-binding protein [Bacillus altitudinis]
MKKMIWLMSLLAVLLVACGQKDNKEQESNTRTYTTETGEKITIPDKPKRIVVLTAQLGNFKKLGVTPVGMTDVYPKSSFLDETGVKRVPIENVEAIAKLKPDLIIAYSQNDQVEKYKKIAKTITFTTSEHSFKEMHIEIGKILGKESLAKKQIQEMDEQLKKDGKEVKAKIGEDKTFSIMDVQPKQVYLFGTDFGRGGEVIYQGYGFSLPEKADKALPKEGYLSISLEEMNEYTGDYLLVPTKDGKAPNPDITSSGVWKKNKAVKQGHVLSYSINEFIYADPISIEKQSAAFKQMLLKN